MNNSRIPVSITNKLQEIIQILNNPEISPRIRQLYQERLYRIVGTAIYNKSYEMAAYDYEMMNMTGLGIESQANRYYGLAKITASVPQTNTEYRALIVNYLVSMESKAQNDAFVDAQEAGKRPEVRRQTTGPDPCKWCQGLATGGWTADYEDGTFHRHVDCSCIIETRGFKSRNGLLKNYKVDKRKDLLEQKGLV